MSVLKTSFFLSNGNPLTSLYPLESDGADNKSSPLEIIDVNHHDGVITVAGDASYKFPTAAQTTEWEAASGSSEIQFVGDQEDFLDLIHSSLKVGSYVELILNDGSNGNEASADGATKHARVTAIDKDARTITIHGLFNDAVTAGSHKVRFCMPVEVIHSQSSDLINTFEGSYGITGSFVEVDRHDEQTLYTHILISKSTPLVYKAFEIKAISHGRQRVVVTNTNDEAIRILKPGRRFAVEVERSPGVFETVITKIIDRIDPGIDYPNEYTKEIPLKSIEEDGVIVLDGFVTDHIQEGSIVQVSLIDTDGQDVTIHASPIKVEDTPYYDVDNNETVIHTNLRIQKDDDYTGTLTVTEHVAVIDVEHILHQMIGVGDSLVALGSIPYHIESVKLQPKSYTGNDWDPSQDPTLHDTYIIKWYVVGDVSVDFYNYNAVAIRNNNYFNVDSFKPHTLRIVQGGVTYTRFDDNGDYVNRTEIVTEYTRPEQEHTTPVIAPTGIIEVVPGYTTFGLVRYSKIEPSSPLQLLGRGVTHYNDYTTWGQALQNNDIRILENFSSSSEPISPLVGQLWHDADEENPALKFRNIYGGWSALHTTDYPSQGDLNMNGHRIYGLPIADGSEPTEAVSIEAGDIRYVNVTGDTMEGILDAGDFKITGLPKASGDDPKEAVSLETADERYINTAGDTMEGILSAGGFKITQVADTDIHPEPHGPRINTNLPNGMDALNLRTADARYINVNGDKMFGNLDMREQHTIVNLINPEHAQDAATKSYVDSLTSGVVWIQPVADSNLFDDSRSHPPTVGEEEEFLFFYKSFYVKPFTTPYAMSDEFTVVLPSAPPQPLEAGDVVELVFRGDEDGTHLRRTYTIDAFDDASSTITLAESAQEFRDHVYDHTGTATLHCAFGEWNGKHERVVAWTPHSSWVDVLGRRVRTGDRFGVFFEVDNDEQGIDDDGNVIDPLLLPQPQGSFALGGQLGTDTASAAGKIVTVNTVRHDGSVDWGHGQEAEYPPQIAEEPYAVSVVGKDSPHFGHSYTFRGMWGIGEYVEDYRWIQFAGPSMIIDGAGLQYNGNVLNVGAGYGIVVTDNHIHVDEVIFEDLDIMSEVFDGEEGQVPFITLPDEEDKKGALPDYLLKSGQYVETDEELVEALDRIPGTVEIVEDEPIMVPEFVYDIRTGDQWVHSGTSWGKSGETIWDTAGVGRLLYDVFTNNMYFVDARDSILPLRVTGKTPSAQIPVDNTNFKRKLVVDSVVIAGNSYHDYDTWDAYGEDFDAEDLITTVRLYSDDETDPTFGMYVGVESSSAVTRIAIREKRYVRVFNLSSEQIVCKLVMDGDTQEPLISNRISTIKDAPILANEYFEYDTWSEYGTNYNANSLVVSARVYITDPDDPASGQFVDSDPAGAVARIAIRDGRYVRVYNMHHKPMTYRILMTGDITPQGPIVTTAVLAPGQAYPVNVTAETNGFITDSRLVTVSVKFKDEDSPVWEDAQIKMIDGEPVARVTFTNEVVRIYNNTDVQREFFVVIKSAV